MKENHATLNFYEENAKSYSERTIVIDMTDIMFDFLKYVPKRGSILDAGSGSGRDTKIFLDLGYNVTAIDGCKELAKISSEYTKHPTQCLLFSEMTFENQFDGIWCSASLLHFSSKNILSILKNFNRALKPEGVWFLSFMYGSLEEYRQGRYFLHLTEEKLKEYLQQLGGLKILECGTSRSREQGKNRDWLQCIVRKQ